MNFRARNIVLVTLLAVSIKLNAQLDGFPLHQEYIENARSVYEPLDSVKHTAVLPFTIKDKSLQKELILKDTAKYYSVFKEKLLRSDFIQVEENDFRVNINPLFDFRVGTDLLDSSAYADTSRFIQNTRGIKIDGQIGKRFYFHTSFFENQATFPLWLKNISDDLKVVPSSGRHKAFNDTGFDFGFSQGWLSYYPLETVNVYFGHGKQFIGHGYRSHLLSHQSFNYPHLKYVLTLLKGKLQVNWSIAALQTLDRQPLGEVPEALFKRKAGSFSYINYLVGKRLQLGIFEANSWRKYDEDLGSQPLEWKAYIPVPLFSAATLKDSTQQSRRVGFNAQFKVTNKASVYGQYVAGLNGIQGGLVIRDLGIKGLYTRIEYNKSDAQISNDDLVNFIHFNEPLGHPASVDEFEEFIGIVHFQKNRLVANVTSSFIYSSNNRFTMNSSLGYILNPSTNTQILLSYLFRNQEGLDSGFLNIGLKSNVFDAFFNF